MSPGWMQNSNESLHAKLWQKCPKTKFFGLFRVIFAVQVTVLDHNFGCDKCNLLVHLFGTNRFIQKGLDIQERRRKMKAVTPKRTEKKRKLEKVMNLRLELSNSDLFKNLLFCQFLYRNTILSFL